jgi:2'-5' RNA ligase
MSQAMETSTFIVVPASEVSPELAEFRRRHIHHPGAVVPLHTTLVHPFLNLNDLEQDGLHRLGELAARIAQFRYQASSICTFPTSNALWLAPTPVAPFEQLTQAIYNVFPQIQREPCYPTYHMTIGLAYSSNALTQALAEFREIFADRLPLHFVCQEIAVFAAVGGTYRLHSALPFGGGNGRSFQKSGSMN